MIIVIDYGMGNLASIVNMIRKVGHEAKISSDISDIQKASKLILPGVGSFDAGISNLENYGLKETLSKRVLEDHVPILGICLGMQLFTRKSSEGDKPGLGWIAADTQSFSFEKTNGTLKIPHMGWNDIQVVQEDPLLSDFDKVPRFYFVHSYHVVCDNQKNAIATTEHGYSFSSVIKSKNIYGAQFHPEKSHRFGMQLLQNFIEKVIC